jgi:formylglycine-generating enzyme required for sulfatase activity
MMRVMFAFAAMGSIAMAAMGPSAAQTCDGIQVDIGQTERRCLQPGGGQVFRDCPECPEMVVAPAGRFTMGAPPHEEVYNERDRELQVQVSIAAPLAVARHAVTRAEFAAFAAATNRLVDGGCAGWIEAAWNRDPQRSWRSPGFAQGDDHPVVCVSWTDAQAYAAWLSSVTGKSYRLLSEAEREYVARAGSTTPYWWGATISTDRANYDGNVTYGGGARGERRNATVAAGTFAPNPWGLTNVHGNVWEWTQDCWNGTNAGNPADGSARQSGDCTLRVLRGASWNNYPHTLRAARREREPEGLRQNSIGFRVARGLPKER